MDSWKFEDHWTVRAPLVCSISGVFFFWKETGNGRFSWALQDPARNHPPGRDPHGKSPSCIPVFFYFCRYRFVLAVLHVEDGSYWSTMGCDSFNVGLPGPAAAPRGSGRGLLSRSRGRVLSEMDDLHSSSSAAFSFFWLGVHASWSAWMSGLDFPVRGISLRRSGHDAGFVWDQTPLLLWHRMWTLFLLSCMVFTLWR